MSDSDEFSEYVAAHRRALLRTACLLTGDFHTAEDLVQSTFARTFLAWRRIRDKGAVDSYVRRIMVNQHITWWRRVGWRRERSVAEPPERVVTPGPDLGDQDELWQIVSRLPRRQRAAIVLRYYEDLSEAETADALGCSIGTVKSQTNRALAKLRAGLEESRGHTFRQAKEVTR